MNHGMRIRCFGTAGVFLLFLVRSSSALAEADSIRRDSIRHAIPIPGAVAILSNLNRLNAYADSIEIVTVTMGRDLGPATYRATGFLHTFSSTDPRDDLVEPLKPRMFRLTPSETWDAYPRARRLGAQVQLVVSDAFGYENGWPGENGEWSAWESTVSSLVTQADSLGYSDIVWDIWNEPNYDRFWGASTEQFNETWRRGFLTIRSLNPGAIIAGPSATGSIDYVKNFLLYAQANNVLPDIVSFHVLFDEERRIPGYVDDLRSFMAGKGINIQRISINEYDSFDTTGTLEGNVGRHIRLLSNLEKARVDSAAKSSWNNAFLDNVAPENTKSALWWAYKAYSDITGNLVSVDSSATVDGVAGKDSNTSAARIVLGRHDGAGDDVGVLIDLLDRAAYLVNSGAVHVTADLITSQTFDNALPRRVIDADYPVTNNQAFVVIPSFGSEDAYVLTLTPSPIAPHYDTSAPSVSLTAPQDGSTVSGVVTVSAEASDDVGVHGVQFKLNGADLGVEDTTFPYAISWDTASATGGSYVLTAIARDVALNQTTSPGVTVTVNGGSTLPGPVAAYSFDEGSGAQAVDSSGNNNTGILVNNTAWTIGRYGNALAFNGNNYVAIADNPSLNAATSFTLTAWIKRDSLIGDQAFFQQGPTAGNWGVYIFDNDNLFGLAAFQVGDVRSSTAFPDSDWHHVAIVKNGETGINVSLYLDGALKGVTSLTGLGASGPKFIGGDAWYNSDFFFGAIDNLRLYGRAITQSEIQTDMNTPIGGRIPETDTTSPTIIFVSPTSGSTVSGTITVSVDASDNVGVYGVQFKLNGANLGVEDTTPPYAISWDTKATANGFHVLTAVARDGAGNTATSAGVNVTVTNDTIPPSTPANLSAHAVSSTQINLSWTASTDNVSVDGYMVFRSGSQVATTTGVGYSDADLSPATSYSYTVLAFDASGNFSPHSSAASATTLGNPLSGLVAAYSFDEGSGTQALDSSGHNNTATFVNGPAWTTGRYGNALALTGGNYVAIADNPSLNATVSFTLTAWLKRASLNGDQVIFQQGPAAGNWGTYIFDGDNSFGLAEFEVADVRSSAPIPDTGWHHIAIVKNGDTGTNVSLYLDGVLRGAASFTGLGASGQKRIGGDAWYNSDFFSGAIDNLRLYARALSQSEIQSDMNTPISRNIP